MECKVNLLQTSIFTKKINDKHWKGDDDGFNDILVKQEEIDVMELSSNDDDRCKEEGETSDSDADEECLVTSGNNKRLDTPSSDQSNDSTYSPSNDKKEDVKNRLSGAGVRIMEILKECSVDLDEMCNIFCDLLQNHNDDIKKKKKLRGKHICSTCSKGFTTDYHLRNHIKFRHLKIYDHVCKICNRAYHNKYILDRHKCSGSD